MEQEQREREALRKRREERLKRELEERSMGETVDGDGVNGQGIMVAMDAGVYTHKYATTISMV